MRTNDILNYISTYLSAIEHTGLYIKKCRNILEISQEKLAGIIEIEPRYLSTIENSTDLISKKTLNKILTIIPISKKLLCEFVKAPTTLDEAYILKDRIANLSVTQNKILHKISPNISIFLDVFTDFDLPTILSKECVKRNYLIQYFSTMKSTGLIISKARQSENISQTQLATIMGITEKHIYMIEKLYSKISRRALKKLIEVLPVTHLFLQELVKGPIILEAAYNLKVSILELNRKDSLIIHKILPRLYYFLDSFNEAVTDDILEPDLLSERKTEFSKKDFE